MMNHLLFPIIILLLLLFHCTTTLAQSPAHAPAPSVPKLPKSLPAHAPSPAGATNLFKILDKAGKFKILIRLLKSSQVGDRINTQINKLKEGLTIFAPTDSAFSSLKAGILNSLSDRDQVELMLFHVLPTFLPTSQFQTVSNPLRTQAGDTSKDQFPLYVTTSGDKVNVSTGIVSATVADTVYSDNRLAVYQVDKVLLPVNIFKSAQLALAPAPAAAATAADSTPDRESPASTTTSNGDSAASRHGIMLSIGVAVIAAFSL